jgi:hypothetical protein
VGQLLARLGWQRDPTGWTVRCRDERGRRTSLRIGLTRDGITITATAPGPWRLTALESGRLRGVMREALLSLPQLPDLEPTDSVRRTSRSSSITREQPGGQG